MEGGRERDTEEYPDGEVYRDLPSILPSLREDLFGLDRIQGVHLDRLILNTLYNISSSVVWVEEFVLQGLSLSTMASMSVE